MPARPLAGLADDAVRHALAAADPAWSARLIERHADAFFLRSEGATLQRWLAALPAGLAGSRPRLLLAQARLALLGHRVEAAEVALDAAECALAGAPGVADEPFEPSVGRAASHLANVPAAIALGRTLLAVLHGDAEHAITFGRRTLAEVGEGEWLLASHANGYLGVAEWLRGRLAEAERALSSSIAQGRAAGQPAMTAWGNQDLGRVQRARGRLDTAAATYRQALEVAAATSRTALPAPDIAYVGLAEVAYQRNELGTALRHVSEGIGACRQMNFTQPLATGLATLAWIRQAQDQVVAVRTLPPARDFQMGFTFEPHGGGTRLTGDRTLDAGLPRWLERIGASRVSSAVRDNLAELKELLETGRVRLQDGLVEAVSS